LIEVQRTEEALGIIRLTGISGLIYAGVCMAQAQAAPPALYTPAQEGLGATVFVQNCAMCHGANLQGDEGPPLVGQKFAGAGTGNTIGSIFSLITQQMPLSNPASLTQTQYEDVMSYILSKNGYPAGNAVFAFAASITSNVPLVSAIK
jgi:mono/diheme cytochrome c family protein